MISKSTYDELENRVQERTAELRKANTQLKHELKERKRTEDVLKTSQKQYSALVENVGDYIMRFDRQFRHIFANHAALELVGLPFEEFFGKTHREMGFPLNLCKLWEDNIQQVFDTGKQKKIEFDMELDNGLMTLELQLNPEFASDGSIRTVIGISRDLTEHKRAKEALRESEEKYRMLFNTASDAIMVFDAKTRQILDVNETCLKLYGYTRKEFLNLTHTQITVEPGKSEKLIKQVIDGKITRIPLRYHKKKDGTKFPVEISTGIIKLGDQMKFWGQTLISAL